jgi:hypothetical protein
MWNEKKLMEWDGNGMKVVESFWNGNGIQIFKILDH